MQTWNRTSVACCVCLLACVIALNVAHADAKRTSHNRAICAASDDKRCPKLNCTDQTDRTTTAHINCKLCRDRNEARCDLNLANINSTLRYDLPGLFECLPANLSKLSICIRNKNTTKTMGFVNTTLDFRKLDRFNASLETFEIGLESEEHYETFYPNYHESTFQALAPTLRRLKINVPLPFATSQYLMLKHLTGLKSLDLSNTLNIGSKSMLNIWIESSEMTPTLRAMCKMTKLTELALNRFQVIGQTDYSSIFDPFQAFNCNNTNTSFPLWNLTLERNFLGRITPGFSQKFPKLKYLSLAYNMLMDARNLLTLAELTSFHPAIESLNISHQGTPPLTQDTNYRQKRTATQQAPPMLLTTILELLASYRPDQCDLTAILAEAEDKPATLCSALPKCFQPTTAVYYASITCNVMFSNCTILNNKTLSGILWMIFQKPTETLCTMVRCALPQFADTPSKHSICYLIQAALGFSPYNTIKGFSYNSNCLLQAEIPVSPNLQDLRFRNILVDLSSIPGLDFSNKICIKKNKLSYLDMSYNKYMFKSMRISDNQMNMRIEGLPKLRTFNAENNGLTINLARLFWVSDKTYNKTHTSTLQMRTLYIGGNTAITSQSSHICNKMPHLRTISLQNMSLSTSMVSEMFRGCHNLTYIDLNYNHFKPSGFYVDLKDCIHKLEFLSLRGCGLQSLHHHIRTQLKSKHSNCTLKIDLDENPWSCNCDTTKFVKWLKKQGFYLNDNLTCSGIDGVTSLSDAVKTVNHFRYKFKCLSTAKFAVLCVLSSLSFVIVVAGTVFVCLRYRWRIRYCCFVTNSKCRRLCSCTKSPLDSGSFNFRYDAYLSFSDTDMHWVSPVLRKQLEDTYAFNVFYRHRDQLGGGTRHERILEAMTESERIILVIGQDYNDDEFCRLEMNYAQHQSVRLDDGTKRPKRIIIVKLAEPVNVSEELSSLLDTHGSIEWSETKHGNKLFWKKLVDAMYRDDGRWCDCFRSAQRRSKDVPVSERFRGWFQQSTGEEYDEERQPLVQ